MRKPKSLIEIKTLFATVIYILSTIYLLLAGNADCNVGLIVLYIASVIFFAFYTIVNIYAFCTTDAELVDYRFLFEGTQ